MTEENQPKPQPKTKNRIWDLPTRLFHILVICLVILSWYTAENMQVFTFGPQDGPTLFELHVYSGITLLTLVIFRLFWGLFGSDTSRFGHFLRGPKAILAYVKGDRSSHIFGHNPLGALSVMLFIALLGIIPSLGLLSSEDTFGLEGPLKHLVSTETSYELAEIHELLFDGLSILVILHVATIIFYAVRGDNLVGPMVTGRTQKSTPEGLAFQPVWRALVFLALAALIVWAVLTFL